MSFLGLVVGLLAQAYRLFVVLSTGFPSPKTSDFPTKDVTNINFCPSYHHVY
jgi:hypothetical protein